MNVRGWGSHEWLVCVTVVSRSFALESNYVTPNGTERHNTTDSQAVGRYNEGRGGVKIGTGICLFFGYIFMLRTLIRFYQLLSPRP